MKNQILLITCVASILLSGCAASRISFDVKVPAVRTVPKEIKSIAIINRSFPANADVNLIEGILTGEGFDQDTLTTQFVMDGLDQSLRGSARFNVQRASETMQGSGIGNMFPRPLTWEIVGKLCDKYNTDALVALEAYDSDFIVSGASAGRNILEMHAQGLVTVHCGFRMYYPRSRQIIDEFQYGHEMEWGGGGLSIIAAADAIINKKRAIEQASLEAGIMYGNRLSPDWIYVSRDYFKRGKGNFDLAQGARLMQLNDWDNAIAALERAMEAPHRKVRGRAAHNLAVIYEILGDLYKAKEWTTVAWGQYREKKSREYGYILTRRIQEAELIEYQER